MCIYIYNIDSVYNSTLYIIYAYKGYKNNIYSVCNIT